MHISRRGLLASSLVLAGVDPSRSAEPAGPPTELAIEAREGVLQLRPDGPATPVLRYGPTEPVTLHARQGQDTTIRIHNRLSAETSLVICGIRGLGSLGDPAAGATMRIAAGGEATVRFTPPDSGTAWFRARFDGADQAARGLSGVLVVDPAASGPSVDQDLVVFLRDWSLDAQNRLDPAAVPGPSVVTLGNKPLPAAFSARPGARLRLRLVNGSTDRVMVVACAGAKPLIVAVDGQPSDLFEPIRDIVPIGPGGRFDLMLDLPQTAGQSVRLVLKGTERFGGVLEGDRLLATVTADGDPAAPRPPIAPLPPNPSLPREIALEASKRAELVIEQAGADWSVNGVVGRDMPTRPVLQVRQGDVVTLGFTNATTSLVPLSLYGQAVRLLHPKDDGWEPYWRDTLLLPPGSRAHVAFVAATPGRWPIESGFSRQATAGLRCWFEVRAARG